MRSFEKLIPISLSLRIVLVGVVLVFVLMPLHPFISTWFGAMSGQLLWWKSWKELLLLGLLGVAIVWLARHKAQSKEFFSDNLVRLVIVYTVLSLVLGYLFLPMNGADAMLAGLAMNLRYHLIFLLVYGVFWFGGISYPKWRDVAGKFILITGIVLSVIGLVQVSLLPADFLTGFGYDKDTTIAPYILIDENEGALRAFATLRGPNDYGAFLILPLVLSLIYARHSRYWLVDTGVILAGLTVSGARSAWIGAAVAVIAYGLTQAKSRDLISRRYVYSAVGLIVAAGIVLVAAVNVPALRLAVFHSSPGDSHLLEGSSAQHIEASLGGVRRVAQQPLGCGVGCAGPASYYGENALISENYFLQIAEETGLIGLALLTTILCIVAVKLWRLRTDWLAAALLASGCGITVIGLFLHVWADDPLALTWWALAGMALAGLRPKH